MAISTAIALGTSGGTADGVTAVITTVAEAPAGSCIVVSAAIAGSTPPATCTDSAGNTYTRIQTSANGSTVANAVFVAFGVALASGGTISVPAPISSAGLAVGATAFTGVGTVQAETLDQYAGNLGSSATPTSSSVTTTTAEQVLIGCFAPTTAPTATADADWPLAHPILASSGSFIRSVVTVYRLVNAIGSYAATTTLSSSVAWAGIIVTLKSGTPPPATVTVRPNATTAAGGWTTGAASLHAALSDQSDATIITGTGA